jgi:DNA-binding GntR family transcriptional regulator
MLSEHALAKELGVSRTPVGEAIRRLADEGLVEQVPRVGTVVRGMRRGDLMDLYEMREALESYAALKAATRLGSRDLAKLQALYDAMQQIADDLRASGGVEPEAEALTSFLAADMAFHMLIVQASGNRRMQRTIAETRTISRIFRTRRQPHDLRIMDKTCESHGKILQALRSGSPDESRAAMAEHIAISRDLALHQLDEEERCANIGGALPLDLPADVTRILDQIDQEHS